jgi:hypothetical protein
VRLGLVSTNNVLSNFVWRAKGNFSSSSQRILQYTHYPVWKFHKRLLTLDIFFQASSFLMKRNALVTLSLGMQTYAERQKYAHIESLSKRDCCRSPLVPSAGDQQKDLQFITMAHRKSYFLHSVSTDGNNEMFTTSKCESEQFLVPLHIHNLTSSIPWHVKRGSFKKSLFQIIFLEVRLVKISSSWLQSNFNLTLTNSFLFTLPVTSFVFTCSSHRTRKTPCSVRSKLIYPSWFNYSHSFLSYLFNFNKVET